MNLCGGHDIDEQVLPLHMADPRNASIGLLQQSNPSSYQLACVACVKVTESEDDLHQHEEIASLVESLVDEDDEDEQRATTGAPPETASYDRPVSLSAIEEPAKSALDTIQLTIETDAPLDLREPPTCVDRSYLPNNSSSQPSPATPPLISVPLRNEASRASPSSRGTRQASPVSTPSRERLSGPIVSSDHLGINLPPATPSPMLLNPVSESPSQMAIRPPLSSRVSPYQNRTRQLAFGPNSDYGMSTNPSSRLMKPPPPPPSTSLDKLIRRLREGFRVRLCGGPTSCWNLREDVILYLHSDLARLCVRSAGHKGAMAMEFGLDSAEEKKMEVVDFWVELMVNQISKVEHGRTLEMPLRVEDRRLDSSGASFTIVVRKEDSALTYYDFEAVSVVEREVIFSTLLVLLDQAHHKKTTESPKLQNGMTKAVHIRPSAGINSIVQPTPPTSEEPNEQGSSLFGPSPFLDFGGTMDQPIPCSPSLEQQQQEHHDPTPIMCFSSGEDGDDGVLDAKLIKHISSDGSQLSPRKSTKIYPADGQTETTLVIKLEDDCVQTLDSMKGHCRLSAISSDSKVASTSDTTGGADTKPEVTGFKSSRTAHGRTLQLQGSSSLAGGNQCSLRRIPEKESVEDESNEETNVQELELASERDIQLRYNPSASSSAVHSATAWCADDLCTSALNDIADTCSGIFAMRQVESSLALSCMSPDQQVLIEEYIATVLGAPTAMYSCFAPGDDDTWDLPLVGTSTVTKADGPVLDPKETLEESPLQDDTTSRFRNRASMLNAQALRMRKLRNEMTFAAALKQSQEKMHFIQTTQSFDEVYLRKAEAKTKAASAAANQFHTSALLQSILGYMMTDSRIVEKTRKRGKQAVGDEGDEVRDIFYDSDPEDIRPRSMHHKGPRRAEAERKNGTAPTDPPGITTSSLSNAGLENVGSINKISRKLDEKLIVGIVQAMNNERLMLMWHPTQTKKEPNLSPVCVKAWIESGVYLIDGTFLLPKLNWAKAYEGKKLQKNKALKKIDLLDICRIRPIKTVNRQLHPFAVAARSFVVETPTDLYLLEAQTPEERDRIVYALKLVIARLASLLMLQDVRAAEEFFGAISTMVPGEAPTFTASPSRQTSSRSSATRRRKELLQNATSNS